MSTHFSRAANVAPGGSKRHGQRRKNCEYTRHESVRCSPREHRSRVPQCAERVGIRTVVVVAVALSSPVVILPSSRDRRSVRRAYPSRRRGAQAAVAQSVAHRSESSIVRSDPSPTRDRTGRQQTASLAKLTRIRERGQTRQARGRVDLVGRRIRADARECVCKR